jgi:predicted nuclease of predicted toxin-antitoxin system
MKRIRLDENIDCLLKGLFAAEFEVITVREHGWTGKKNGELLRLAEQEFDVFITMDKNLEHQQNLRALNIAVIVVRARSNAYRVVAPLMPEVNEALRVIQSGQVIHVMG